MPIFITTYTNPRIKEEIIQTVGSSFSFWQRLKFKGIGSPRMIIEERDPFFDEYTNPHHYLTYANFELRPKGIIIHIHKTLQNFNWALPYGTFDLERTTDRLIVHAEDKFLAFRDGQQLAADFINKVQIFT